MPINSVINKDLNVIIRTVKGELTGVDMTSAFTESLSDSDFNKNMHVIWDLTEADISKVSADQLIEIVMYIHDNIGDRGADYKIIIVAPIDIIIGKSRIFEGYGTDLPISIHILRELQDAYKLIKGKAD